MVVDRQLDAESLLASVKALVELADRRTIQPLQLEYEDDDRHDPSRPLPYDPASVFLLEIMTSIAVHTPDKLEEIW